MSIQRLPIFLSAAEHLNFTKAAEEHHISQTAVSQQIKQLEKELGFQLFVRGKRGVTLTPAGAEYYRQCKKIMAQYQTAVTKGQRVAGGHSSSLTIGYAGAYELWNATKLIREYYRAHPNAQIDLKFASNQTLLGDVSAGKIDIAVICDFGVELSDWLGAKQLSNDPCVLMISADHPLAQKQILDRKDIANLPIALNRAQDSQTTASQILQMYSHLGMSGNKRYYIDDFYSLAMLVSSGLAVSVVPDSMRQMAPDGLAFIPIMGFHSTAGTMVVYQKNNPGPAVKYILELL